MTHLAWWIVQDILKKERAENQKQRHGARKYCDLVGFHRANIRLSSSNALNSSALPLGSRMKNVACSPGSPAKRVSGGIENSALPGLNLSIRVCHCVIDRITPKCRTGTSSPSTSLCALSIVAFALRWATIW